MNAHKDNVLSLLVEMAPKDPFESMLVTRMISLHYMGMRELEKANLDTSMDSKNQHVSRGAVKPNGTKTRSKPILPRGL